MGDTCLCSIFSLYLFTVSLLYNFLLFQKLFLNLNLHFCGCVFSFNASLEAKHLDVLTGILYLSWIKCAECSLTLWAPSKLLSQLIKYSKDALIRFHLSHDLQITMTWAHFVDSVVQMVVWSLIFDHPEWFFMFDD